MACFFGHKWDGCKCAKCGETRDEQHKSVPVPGQCLMRCERCGKEIKWHPWPNAGDALRVCPICGKGEIQLGGFFNEDELPCFLPALMNFKKTPANNAGIDVFGAIYRREYLDAALFVELLEIIERPAFAQMLSREAGAENKIRARASLIAKGQELKNRLEQ